MKSDPFTSQSWLKPLRFFSNSAKFRRTRRNFVESHGLVENDSKFLFRPSLCVDVRCRISSSARLRFGWFETGWDSALGWDRKGRRTTFWGVSQDGLAWFHRHPKISSFKEISYFGDGCSNIEIWLIASKYFDFLSAKPWLANIIALDID